MLPQPLCGCSTFQQPPSLSLVSTHPHLSVQRPHPGSLVQWHLQQRIINGVDVRVVGQGTCVPITIAAEEQLRGVDTMGQSC